MTNSNIPQRLQRLALLLQEEGIQKLNESRVLVLGLGGVGSSCVEALARGGIGHLALLDGDVVEESNINRQAIAFTSTVGRAKTEVMREMVLAINPGCDVDARKQFLTRENTADMLDSFAKPDVVLDCIDTVSQKLEIVEWCANQQIPLLSAMGAANKRDPMALRFSLVEKTFNCPLSKVMRRECRKRGISQLEVIFSTESPLSPQPPRTSLATKTATRSGKAETLGSMSYMPPIMGQMMAGKVICRLAGLEKMPNPPRKKLADERMSKEGTPNERKTKEKTVEKQTADDWAKNDVSAKPYLLDTHAHWDFLPSASREKAARLLGKENIRLVAQTVLPSAFVALDKEREGAMKADHDAYPQPILSLGFHPWWVDTPEKNRRELDFFAEALPRTRFIGEVGLDFSEKRLREASAVEQQAVLRHIFQLVRERAAESNTSYVFSFHAVRALTPLLDLYEEENLVMPNVVPIVHRFAGTSDELTRLIRMGGLLSVHPAMLRTKRGRAYVKQVPADSLLLETDLPANPIPAEQSFSTREEKNDMAQTITTEGTTQKDAYETVARTYAEEIKQSLYETLARLSELRGEDMTNIIMKTQKRLYGWPKDE
ncbi:TatD family hydrolase [Murdochiella vaginalis]|uniref:TatD family hydrolase n=1 Tax=Murdochiella vaginalis TaxID=1852373 RepID=UPI0008FD9A68|nr:TatD family hydrolase [Murdochiella vaginalis]